MIYLLDSAVYLLNKWGMVYDDIVQLTADNSNLQGKLKKVQVIGSSKQITRRKEMGWGGGRTRNARIMTYTAPQGRAAR